MLDYSDDKEKKELAILLLNALDNVILEYGTNAIVHIRAGDKGGVTIYDTATNRMVYDTYTLAEFTHRFG